MKRFFDDVLFGLGFGVGFLIVTFVAAYFHVLHI